MDKKIYKYKDDYVMNLTLDNYFSIISSTIYYGIPNKTELIDTGKTLFNLVDFIKN